MRISNGFSHRQWEHQTKATGLCVENFGKDQNNGQKAVT